MTHQSIGPERQEGEQGPAGFYTHKRWQKRTQGQGGGTRTAGSLDDLGKGVRLMFGKCHRPNPFPQKRTALRHSSFVC